MYLIWTIIYRILFSNEQVHYEHKDIEIHMHKSISNLWKVECLQHFDQVTIPDLS